jgi:hypothetical protein
MAYYCAAGDAFVACGRGANSQQKITYFPNCFYIRYFNTLLVKKQAAAKVDNLINTLCF